MHVSAEFFLKIGEKFVDVGVDFTQHRGILITIRPTQFLVGGGPLIAPHNA